ncbi:MAG: hypothetical protein ACE5IJ_10370 [Thermoplasmata archaeon]
MASQSRKAAVSIVLLVVAALLFLVPYSSWQQADDMVFATYLVGAALVFAIALIPWAKD